MTIKNALITLLAVVVFFTAIALTTEYAVAFDASAVVGAFVDSATSCYWIGDVMYCN